MNTTLHILRNTLHGSLALLLGGTAWVAEATELPTPVLASDYYDSGRPSVAKQRLGNFLFFDKILSGNKNISCATCHHPKHFGGDGLSLPIGEGGEGLGTLRTTGSGDNAILERVGRNAPPLFNLGAKEFVHLNWQGRHQNKNGRISIPCATKDVNACPDGLDNVLAGQNLFPMVNTPEMLGHPLENDVSTTKLKGVERFPVMWATYVARLAEVDDYVELFRQAYPDVQSAADMKIHHVVNALAAFQSVTFRSDRSAFDSYLRGNASALSAVQKRGMDLFYGKANCASCHSGKFQTDHAFYAIAMPQAGPGVFVNGRSLEAEDVGRYEVTGAIEDRYKFRTPSLRNVGLTAPYGHDGAYATLDAMVRHHLNPVEGFANWDAEQMVLPSRSDLDELDHFIMSDAESAQRIVAANQLAPVELSESETQDLLAFLGALTDATVADKLMLVIPSRVPSGLPVED
jgi:cytochrome c peroxidase